MRWVEDLCMFGDKSSTGNINSVKIEVDPLTDYDRFGIYWH